MSPQGQKNEVTVKILGDVYKDFKDLVESKNMEIKSEMSRIIKGYTLKARFSEKYKPYLELNHVQNNSVVIWDHKLNENVYVKLTYVNDREDSVNINCEKCKSDSCIHVVFAFQTDELAEADINFKKKRT
jgi:mitochondrial fission protein ELM1